MCSCELQIQWRAVLGSRYAPGGVVAIPMSAVKSCMSLVTSVLYTPSSLPSLFLRARMKSSHVSWVVNFAMRVSLKCSNVAGLALSLSRLSDPLTACSAIRCPQCNCFAYNLRRLRLFARDFCESCHSDSLGCPGLKASSILGKRKSKNSLQQRGVVCEKVTTTLIGACTPEPPYHCIWSSQEHMAAGLERSSMLGKMKSKHSLQKRGVVCEMAATTLIGACTQVPPCHCICSSQELMAACMILSEPRSSASFLTPMKPRMDPFLCCQGFEELLMWWPLDRQIILHFAEGYSDKNAKALRGSVCFRLNGGGGGRAITSGPSLSVLRSDAVLTFCACRFSCRISASSRSVRS